MHHRGLAINVELLSLFYIEWLSIYVVSLSVLLLLGRRLSTLRALFPQWQTTLRRCFAYVFG
jgi:hypothetical protein